jgi:hypothetical protein
MINNDILRREAFTGDKFDKIFSDYESCRWDKNGTYQG